MKKRMLALILCAMMTGSLITGCGSSSESSGSSEDSEEIVTVSMTIVGGAGAVDDIDAVLEQVNPVLEEECNANLEVNFIDIGGYSDQVNLEISSGDGADIYAAFNSQLTSLYSQDAMMDITELVEEYGQGIIETVGEEYMQAGYKNGALVMIPTMTAFASETSILYRKDIAEKYGLDMDSVTCLEDMEEILEIVCSGEEGMIGLISNNPDDSMLYQFNWDSLGDEYGVLMDPTSSTEVVDLFETQEYADYVNLMHSWYEAGYIQSDASTSQDNIATLLGNGDAFAVIYTDGIPEADIEQSAGCGYELGIVAIADAISTTSDVTGQVLFINSMSENGQKAIEVLNVLYTNYEVQTLLEFGIEGTNYTLTEDGLGTYIEGTDMNSCNYHPMFGAFFGNTLNCLTWGDSHTTEYSQSIQEFNDEAGQSLALGFSYDSSSVSNQISALATVTAKYRRGLECGSMDPSELDNFIAELKTAGIDDVITEKQSQLDEWLASNS